MQSQQRIYWIGGCPSGGKTTLAGELSKANNLTIYHTDDHSLEYGLRINSMVPDFHKEININFVESIISMPDELWFDIFITGLRGLCSIIFDDVTKLYVNGDVIIEGGELLPEFIAEMGFVNQAILINPTYEYLQEYLPKQKWVVNILSNLSDIDYQSLFVDRLVYKYNLFREYIIDSAKKLNVKTIYTSNPNSIENNIKITAEHFSLSIQ